MNSQSPATVETVEPSERTSAGEGQRPDVADDRSLPKDLIFELLKNWRRRQVLRYLDANDGTARLDQLAEHIAAMENGIDEQALSSSERKRVYIALYQCHLPKLDDVGVVDYEQARGNVQLREEAASLFPYLYLRPSTDDDSDGLIGSLFSKFSRP